MELRPLVPLTDRPGQPFAPPPLSDQPYDKRTRRKLADYLENAPTIIAWMGASRDLLGDRFDWVGGGMAIMSDEVWYWRYDAGEYIRHYPIRIPDEALAYFEANDWQPPVFSDEYRDQLDLEISKLFGLRTS